MPTESFIISVNNEIFPNKMIINIDNYDVESNLPTPNINSFNDPIFRDKELVDSFIKLQKLSIKMQLIINSICYMFMKK